MAEISLPRIRQALALSGFDALRAQQRMAPEPRPLRRPVTVPDQARQGAVLVLLYPGTAGPDLVFIRRPDDLNAHAGQIAFPGGQQDRDERLVETALRETKEEIGVPPGAIQVLGTLSPIYIPVSDFEVHPFVGWHAGRPRFTPSADEVAEILEAPLNGLLDPTRREVETWFLYGMDVVVPFFRLGPHKVWGATAIILEELIERLRVVAA